MFIHAPAYVYLRLLYLLHILNFIYSYIHGPPHILYSLAARSMPRFSTRDNARIMAEHRTVFLVFEARQRNTTLMQNVSTKHNMRGAHSKMLAAVPHTAKPLN